MFNNKIKTLIVLILFFYSCKQNEIRKNKYDQQLVSRNEKWVGQKILFSKSLKPFDSQKLKKQYDTKFTIVTYYDGSCSFCFFQLMKWVEAEKTLSIYDVSFIYILAGLNITVLEINLEKIKFPLKDVFHDSKDEFGGKYNFLLEKGYVNSSILLNQNNKVLYIGNPTISEDDKNKFIELMKN